MINWISEAIVYDADVGENLLLGEDVPEIPSLINKEGRKRETLAT